MITNENAALIAEYMLPGDYLLDRGYKEGWLKFIYIGHISNSYPVLFCCRLDQRGNTNYRIVAYDFEEVITQGHWAEERQKKINAILTLEALSK
jgi:hypothetical protein